jgi:hypothetical protein
LLGCSQPLCESELKVGTTYTATMSELYNADSSAKYDPNFDQYGVRAWPSCEGFDGIAPKAAVSFKVSQAISLGACRQLSGEVVSLPVSYEWHYTDLAVKGGFERCTAFIAEGEVKSGDYTGVYRFTLCRTDKGVSLFTATAPGQLPSVVVGRSFWVTTDASVSFRGIQWCADTFVARLSQ